MHCTFRSLQVVTYDHQLCSSHKIRRFLEKKSKTKKVQLCRHCIYILNCSNNFFNKITAKIGSAYYRTLIVFDSAHAGRGNPIFLLICMKLVFNVKFYEFCITKYGDVFFSNNEISNLKKIFKLQKICKFSKKISKFL